MGEIEIIPAIDIMEGHTVRLSQGDYGSRRVYDESPYDAARRYADAGFMRIHAVDLDGAKAASPRNLRVLEKLASIDGIRVEWGGGIKGEEALKDVFDAGAYYAVIGSIAACDPRLFTEWLGQYGGDRMVLGADILDGTVKINGWLDGAGMSLDELLMRFLPHGLRRVIITDISRDGMLQGPAFGLYGRVHRDYPDLELTVSGGISSMRDIERLDEMNLNSVIVGKALYEGYITLNQLIEYRR